MIEHTKNGYICKCDCGRVIGPFGTIRELVEALIDKGGSITYDTSDFLLKEVLHDEDLSRVVKLETIAYESPADPDLMYTVYRIPGDEISISKNDSIYGWTIESKIIRETFSRFYLDDVVNVWNKYIKAIWTGEK